MLNEDLINPRDIEVAKLKITIDRFKEYDEKRKKYYAESLQELGELRSYVEELENDKGFKKLRKKIDKLHKEVEKLNSIIIHNEYVIPTDNNTLLRYSLEKKNVELQKTNKILNETNRKLRRTNKELTDRIIELTK